MSRCEPWCVDACENLNGDVARECGECTDSRYRCRPDSFRVAWIERRYQDGSLASTERWSAILTIVVQTPRDPENLRANPLGIYVNAINWSKELGQ